MNGAGRLTRTPGPTHVRLVVLSLFALGLGMGFLGVLLFPFAAPLLRESEAAGIAAAGACLAALPGRRLARRTLPGPLARGGLATLGAISAAALIVLPFHDAAALEYALPFVVGMATAGCWRLLMGLLRGMRRPGRDLSLLALGGVSAAAGGLSASLLAWVLASARSASLLGPLAAAVPALLAVLAIHSGRARLEPAALPARRPEPSAGTGPRGALFAASLLCQAAACGIAACWLPVLLARGYGLSLPEGALVLAAAWLALVLGLVVSRRLPRATDGVLALGCLAGIACVGAVALFFGQRPVAAWLGAPLLGFGTGALLALTLALVQWPATLVRCRWTARAVNAFVAAALLAGWSAGLLAAADGGYPLLAVLVCLMAALASLMALVGEYRFSGDPAPT